MHRRYAGSVCVELDDKWAAYKGGGPARVTLDLTDRIASTGTEAKAANTHTGVIFEIDLGQMVQRNVSSGFQRPILREAHATQATPQSAASIRGARSSTSNTNDGMQITMSRSKTGKRQVVAPAADADVARARPADIAGEDLLILHQGQLLQISKQRPDGWTFGSVCYDEQCPDGRPPSGTEGFSTSTGWFPLDKTVTFWTSHTPKSPPGRRSYATKEPLPSFSPNCPLTARQRVQIR